MMMTEQESLYADLQQAWAELPPEARRKAQTVFDRKWRDRNTDRDNRGDALFAALKSVGALKPPSECFVDEYHDIMAGDDIYKAVTEG